MIPFHTIQAVILLQWGKTVSLANDTSAHWSGLQDGYSRGERYHWPMIPFRTAEGCKTASEETKGIIGQ